MLDKAGYLSLSFSPSLLLSYSGACHEDVAARVVAMPVSHRLAIARPKLSGRRSSSTFLSQVCLGLPVLRRQSLGRPRMQAWRARGGLDQYQHGTDDQEGQVPLTDSIWKERLSRTWANHNSDYKKLSCCCDSRSYCVQYFNAIHCEHNISTSE